MSTQTNVQLTKEQAQMLMVKPADFNAQNVVISPPKKDRNGKTNAYVLYKNEALKKVVQLRLETPKSLIANFGISRYEKGNTGVFDYSLPLGSYSTIESERPVSERFFEELKKLDEMMIDYGLEHSKMLTGKNITSREGMEMLYSRIVKLKERDDGTYYPPNISPKFYKSYEDKEKREGDGFPNVKLYVGNTEPLSEVQVSSWEELYDYLPEKVRTTVAIQFRFWTVNNKFGLTVNLTHVRVHPRESTALPDDFVPFSDLSTSTTVSSTTEQTLTEQTESASAEDSNASEEDGEEEEDDEVEEVEDSEEEIEVSE